MENGTQAPLSVSKPARRPVKRVRRLVIGLLILLLLIVGGGASYWYWAGKPHFDENKHINHSEYQALFLTNGQVYFGKLADLNHTYVTISNIYYLQVQQGQTLQSGSTSTNTSQSQVSLAKLGSELHGPEDKMFVASDQVLFWENLKNDSKVVQAIDKFQNQ